MGPLLWLALYPLDQLADRASRGAYEKANQLSRSLWGQELSAPFGEAAEESQPLLSVGSVARWLGIGGLLYILCRVIVGLAQQLARERPVGYGLRLAFGVFLFSNLMVLAQRLRNVWFFRRLEERPQALEALRRQDPAMLYWTGLATYLQAAALLFAAWVVAPSGWLLGGVVGLLLRARRYRESLQALPPEEPDQGAS